LTTVITMSWTFGRRLQCAGVYLVWNREWSVCICVWMLIHWLFWLVIRLADHR